MVVQVAASRLIDLLDDLVDDLLDDLVAPGGPEGPDCPD